MFSSLIYPLVSLCVLSHNSAQLTVPAMGGLLHTLFPPLVGFCALSCYGAQFIVMLWCSVHCHVMVLSSLSCYGAQFIVMLWCSVHCHVMVLSSLFSALGRFSCIVMLKCSVHHSMPDLWPHCSAVTHISYFGLYYSAIAEL